MGSLDNTRTIYDQLNRGELISRCEGLQGRINELQSGIENELEDIRLTAQNDKRKIARLRRYIKEFLAWLRMDWKEIIVDDIEKRGQEVLEETK